MSKGVVVALTILPSDGFITRLLQQAHHSAPAPSGGGKAPPKQDQVLISNEARQATQASSGQHLESKLMELYNQKGEGAL